MFGVAWSLNFILLGSTGRISVIAGPINDELGAMQRIHPYRRANITDAVVSTFSYFIPWHLWPLVTLYVIEPLAETYDFITTPAPSDFLLTTGAANGRRGFSRLNSYLHSEDVYLLR